MSAGQRLALIVGCLVIVCLELPSAVPTVRAAFAGPYPGPLASVDAPVAPVAAIALGAFAHDPLAAESDATLTGLPLAVPTASIRPLAVPASSIRPLAVPASSIRPLAVPASSIHPLAVPASSIHPLAVPASSIRPLAVPASSGVAFTLPR